MSGSTRLRRRTVAILLSVVALAAAHWIDPWAVEGLRIPSANDRDWGRLLRIMGFAPTWALIAGALWLEAGRLDPDAGALLRDSAKSVLVAIAVGGLVAEIVKLLVRRDRPDDVPGYGFRPFGVDPFSSKGFGIPSSHATVAFAGAAALSYRFPRAAPILYGLAAGCGLTRVFAHAHFLSDIVAAGIAGTWVGRTVAAWFDRRRARVATG